MIVDDSGLIIVNYPMEGSWWVNGVLFFVGRVTIWWFNDGFVGKEMNSSWSNMVITFW